jgi:(2Fe-2S) ferredoxin
MPRINDMSELLARQAELKAQRQTARDKGVVIRIAMATCSIASGAQAIMDYFSAEMPKIATRYQVISTGCNGACHSEPTVEVLLPGQEPRFYGEVDLKKAATIVNDYIKKALI